MTEEFIQKSILVHGYKYNYSKVYYKSAKEKVVIICKTHGEFSQVPFSHTKGMGCRKCGTEKRSLRDACTAGEMFAAKAIEKHGDVYDYSKVYYKNSLTPVIIICNEHGEFLQTPNHHLSGVKCTLCATKIRAKKRTLTTNMFIAKAMETHGDKYDYSKVDYKKAIEYIIIICKKHGEFLQIPISHTRGKGCKKCGTESTSVKVCLTNDTFIQRATETHGDKYDYSKVDYTRIVNNVIINCKTHGEFLQTPNNHLRGAGCPICINKTESILYDKIKLIYPSLLTQFKQYWCKKNRNLPYDFCISELKIIIELDGPQHFKQIMNWSSPEEQFENDKYKEECANKNGYSVIRLLQQDVYYDTYDWVKELCDAIEEIKTSNEITNIYLCKNDEYDLF